MANLFAALKNRPISMAGALFTPQTNCPIVSGGTGIWLDLNISPISSAERVTQIQMGQQLLNNSIHVTTPEMFVGDDLGVRRVEHRSEREHPSHLVAVSRDGAVPYVDVLLQLAISDYWPRCHTSSRVQP